MKDLIKQYLDNGMSRRQLMTGLSALGMSTAAVKSVAQSLETFGQGAPPASAMREMKGTGGALFGPTATEGHAVSARVFGTGKGRRYPTFAVGLNGQGTSAYKLQVSPAKKSVELFKGDAVRASVPYEWQSGTWTRLWLQVRRVKDGEWKVEGKVWTEGAKESSTWTVSSDEKEEPVVGKASIWGSPYSTTPIRFDDLVVTAAREKP